nr:tRNA (N6-threonylcarbamoyladenosine(37)-N6)-methyltransferase TrmO [uncultured Desulfobacter sp.]
MKIEINPIGKIHSPFKEPEGMPIQPTGANGVQGTVEIFDKFKAGLNDLDGFSHIILLYLFHRSKGYNLQVIPFMDDTPRGVFATRAPKRPNPIGLSVVKLERIENGILHVQNIDILDETPLLDIKPYVEDFDRPQKVRSGWIAHSRDKVSIKKSDDRFK